MDAAGKFRVLDFSALDADAEPVRVRSVELAHDLMEPVRPVVDGMILDLLAEHALEKGEVYETREGVCRLGPPMARRLAGWAPSLRPALANSARELEALLLGTPGARPARRRNATTASKGGKRRLAVRASP